MSQVLDLNGNGAVYHRVSGDKQDLERQREATTKFLSRHAVAVTEQHVYEDINWTRDEADIRPAFQRMLQAADRKDIRWIVIDHRTRWGTKDKWQRVEYITRLHKAGCHLYTASDEVLSGDSLLDLIQTGMDGEASERELREKAEGVIGGKVTRAADGEWMGGHVPYGCCVVCIDQDRIREKWRVEITGRDVRVRIDRNGEEEHYNGKGNFPPAGQTERLELRPSSDPQKLKVVQDVFHWFVQEKIAYSAMARRLNLKGISTQYGESWRSGHVLNLLANPIYTGRMPYNRNSVAKYVEYMDGKKRPVDKEDFGRFRKRKKSDWVLSRPLFEPMVASEVWEQAQAKMAEHKMKKSPRSPQMWLSGLLFCAHCGQPLRANVQRKKQKRGVKTEFTYICATYSKSILSGNRSCQRHSVSHEQAEEIVKQYLHDAGQHLRDIAAPSKSGDREEFGNAVVQPVRQIMAAVKQMRARLNIPDEQRGVPVDALMERFAEVYAKEQPGLVQRYDALQREHDLLTDNLLRLPKAATRAVAKAQQQIISVEAEMASAERRLEDAGERCLAAMNLLLEQLKAWDRARTVLAEDVAGRTKAEAVSKIIKGIYFWFQSTGRKRPATEIEKYKVVPVGGEDGDGNDGGSGPSSHGDDGGFNGKYPSVMSSMRCGIFT